MSNDTENSIHNPFYSQDTKAPINDDWAAKRRLADALRDLTEQLVTTTVTADVLNDLTAAIHAQSAKLAEHSNILGRTAYLDETDTDYGSMASIGYELNPLDGRCNPIAAPMKVWIDDAEQIAYGEANMGWAYEGPPNSVHGGFVAALFDQFLGVAQKITGQPGVTGTLSIRYLKPTPLNTDLKFVGKLKSVQGRKNVLTAEIWADDVKTATCEGLFIRIDREAYLKMRENNPA